MVHARSLLELHGVDRRGAVDGDGEDVTNPDLLSGLNGVIERHLKAFTGGGWLERRLRPLRGFVAALASEYGQEAQEKEENYGSGH